MPKQTQNPKMVKTGIILIIVGLLGLVFPYLSFGFFREENFITKFTTANVAVTPTPSGTPTTSKSPTPNPNAPNIKNRLLIPGANIDMALIESNSITALWRGGWVFPQDSTPDKGGNTVIFGHRFKYLPPITNTLYSLDKVKMGDGFQIVWKGKNYYYQVTDIKVVNPTDVYVLDPSSTPQVTIITCFPLFSTKQRLVVIGQLVSSGI